MEIVTALLTLGTSVANYLVEKNKTKYQGLADEIARIKKEWYEEFNKTEDTRSNLTLDRLRRELLITIDQLNQAMAARKD